MSVIKLEMKERMQFSDCFTMSFLRFFP